jgi:hypothetical protein
VDPWSLTTGEEVEEEHQTFLERMPAVTPLVFEEIEGVVDLAHEFTIKKPVAR